MPRIKGRWPKSLFSSRRPGTHIEPHCGMVNTRLICHIPLIVPQGCRLRVGNETRTVAEGRPLLFDDSIEHAAWHDGAGLREIGRASCRERVCQYVELSAVAVSLKKK